MEAGSGSVGGGSRLSDSFRVEVKKDGCIGRGCSHRQIDCVASLACDLVQLLSQLLLRVVCNSCWWSCVSWLFRASLIIP